MIASYYFAMPAKGRGTQHMRLLSQTKWDVVIIDEAHHVSESAGGESKKLYQLAKVVSDPSRAESLLLLSATPHDGKPDGFLSLIRLLDPYLVADEDRLDYKMIEPVVSRRLKTAVVRSDGSRFQERELHVLDDLKQGKTELELHAGVLEYADAITELAETEENTLRRYTLPTISPSYPFRICHPSSLAFPDRRPSVVSISASIRTRLAT